MKKVKGKEVIGTLLVCFMFMLSFAFPALGTETDESGIDGNSQGLVLTIEDARQRAVLYSNAVKMADKSIEQGELNRNSAAEKVNYTPLSGGDDEVTSAFLKLIQSDISWQMTKKEKEASIDVLEKEVFQKYTNVLTAREKVEAAEKALKYADFQRLAARVGYQVKKESLSSKNAAERSYTAKEVALAKSRNNLEDSWRAFNKLVGLDARVRPVLKDDPQFSAYAVSDLEMEILRKMDIDLDIWQSNKQIEQAQLAVDLYTWNTGGESYAVKKLAVEKAALSASNTKAQVRESIIAAYNNLFNLEQQYQTAEEDLATAEETLNTAQLKYEIGIGSKGDILKAEADLANARQALKSTAYEHELAEISFEKPWVN